MPGVGEATAVGEAAGPGAGAQAESSRSAAIEAARAPTARDDEKTERRSTRRVYVAARSGPRAAGA